MSTARANKECPGDVSAASFIILVACAISFVRLGLLVASTAPAFLPSTLPALGLLFGVLFIGGWVNSRMGRSEHTPVVSPGNPAALKTPLLFGTLYAVMLVVIAAANKHFGHQGVYVAASLSGLTDMDAITLSVTNLVNAEKLPSATGWRVIVVAALANLVFKGSVVAFIGERRLMARVWAVFAVAAAAATALLFFGPN